MKKITVVFIIFSTIVVTGFGNSQPEQIKLKLGCPKNNTLKLNIVQVGESKYKIIQKKIVKSFYILVMD